MIAYIEGKLFKKEEDKIVLLAGHVGYEILLPMFVMETVQDSQPGDELTFYIYYHQTERQPKPILIGFNDETEKAFFQLFISVGDIGPLKAVKALNASISEVAGAIESGDAGKLKQMKGIGSRTAQKIIASLGGRVEQFVLDKAAEAKESLYLADFAKTVMDVLVSQLGYKQVQARSMVTAVLRRNRNITTAEDLFDEVYRGGLDHG
jgi:Holliday junction DNA helicase RuvA